jgi:hypothetical protein
MPKADRVLGYFPSSYRALDKTSLLREVVSTLSQPLETADTLLFRIQRAHRINVAEFAADMIRLAGILNLDSLHFEDLLSDKSLNNDQRLDLMRKRIARIARVHLIGLGTPWAIAEAAAIFLNANIVSERMGDRLLKQVDLEGFSHKATLEFFNLPDKPREPLYLHEFPLRRNKVDPVERWPLDSWQITNASPDAVPVRILIQGVQDRTVRPSVFCPASQQGILFNGIVPDGKTLVIDAFQGALLDKDPVDDWLIYFEGAIADFSREGQSSFVLEEAEIIKAFDGDTARIGDSSSAHRHVPTALPGPSEWRFKVADAVYDAADLDFCAMGVPSDPIGIWDGDFRFDHSVFTYPSSGITGMAWDERVSCSFKLLLPSHVPVSKSQANVASTSPPASPGPVTRIAALMPRFKGAGIQVFVDVAKDAWILGSSLLRDPGAQNGEGIEFHSTRVINSRTELYAP